MNPKVSIVITNYNLGDYLEEAVNSVLNQTYQNWELVIIDDGSTEKKSAEKIEYYKSLNNPKIIVLDEANQGVVKARNYAATKTDGEFICFLDADDKLRSDFLEKTLALISLDETVGFVTTDYKVFGSFNTISRPPEPLIENMLLTDGAHTSSLIRRKTFDEVSGYDPDFFGYMDWDLWLSIIEKSYTWKVLREPVFLYRVRSNSMVTKSNGKDETLFGMLVDKHLNLYANFFKDLAKDPKAIPMFIHKKIFHYEMELRKAREGKGFWYKVKKIIKN